METLNALLNALSIALAVFIPIFVAMDPAGAVPLIIAWTGDLPPEARHRQLRDALLTALAVGLVFLFVGRWLLAALGIGVPDFEIAGGLILLVLAVSDIATGGGYEARGSPSSPDFGVVPIGTPLLAGPAILTTLLVLVDRYGIALTVLAFLVNLLIAWRLFWRASDLTRLLGRNGLRATSKVISLLLAAIAIKFIREGVMLILNLPTT
ncbi:MAG: MarC family protein [Chloroflexi bacterium]|nr:MarC family protein [Chloroflexota bacterium]